MAAKIVSVTFRFPCSLAPRASHIALLGPFNGWNPKIHVMTKTSEGSWVIELCLPPGRTVYCFDVDGACWLDPNDEGRIPNGWGSEYSVRYVAGTSPHPAYPGRPRVPSQHG
jgi:Glycogen recognition site of AMP-activated protein kinase